MGFFRIFIKFDVSGSEGARAPSISRMSGSLKFRSWLSENMKP